VGSIRPLREDDDRSRFRSGDPHLDRYFQVYAGQNQFRHKVSVTYVFEESGGVAGYATLAGGEIRAERLPPGAKRLPAYPLPILRLARLAVAQSARGTGIGAQLLRHAFSLALAMSTTTGCVGVLVDPKSGAESFHERFGFIRTRIVEGELLGGSTPAPYFISLEKVRNALAGP
jgi:predicted N-acetyltransferase YhbS